MIRSDRNASTGRPCLCMSFAAGLEYPGAGVEVRVGGGLKVVTHATEFYSRPNLEPFSSPSII